MGFNGCRSMKCERCRSMKIKCSEDKPCCTRCERAKADCVYPDFSKTKPLFCDQTGYAAANATARWRVRSKHGQNQHERISQTGGRSRGLVQDNALLASTCKLVEALSWPKDSETLHLCYLQRNWATEDASWIEYCLENENTYPTANLAIRTLASGIYGKWNRQTTIIASARSLYGRALRALRNALSDNKKVCTFDALASISALQRYEAILLTTSTGWIHHSGGIAHAVEVSGPQCFKQFPHKAILDANMYYIIQESHHYRKRSFLVLEEWTCYPKLKTQEGHFEQLQTLYARSAGLTASCALFIKDPNPEMYLDGLQEADDLLQDLETWIMYWSEAFSFSPVEKITSRGSTNATLDDEYYSVFKSSLHYPSLLAGLGTNIFRAIKITALVYRDKFQHYFWAPEESPSGMHEVQGIHPLAVDICRTLHIHFGENTLYHGWFSMFCAMCAYRGLDPESKEAEWIRTTLADMSRRRGIALAENLVHSYTAKWKAEDAARAQMRACAWLTQK